MRTVRLDELISDEQWNNEAWSDIDIKKQKDQISKDARKRCNEDPDKESRMIPIQMLDYCAQNRGFTDSQVS